MDTAQDGAGRLAEDMKQKTVRKRRVVTLLCSTQDGRRRETNRATHNPKLSNKKEGGDVIVFYARRVSATEGYPLSTKTIVNDGAPSATSGLAQNKSKTIS